MTEWFLYLVRCPDQSLYTGITTDVESRFASHCAGTGAKYLRGRSPLSVVFSQAVGDRSLASKLEYRVKRLAKADKERLATGELELLGLLGEDQEKNSALREK